MNSQQATEYRVKVNEVLNTIIILKDKLERLEKTETSAVSVSLDFGKVSISNEFLIGAPVRAFIRHQIIMRLKDKIKIEEERLQNLNYHSNE